MAQPKDHGQIALDCAVVQQALADIRKWNRPVRPEMKEEPETLIAFKDAIRWVFSDGDAQEHFSLVAICLRLELPFCKVRAGVEARLTENQRAWMHEALRRREAA